MNDYIFFKYSYTILFIDIKSLTTMKQNILIGFLDLISHKYLLLYIRVLTYKLILREKLNNDLILMGMDDVDKIKINVHQYIYL